MCPYQTALGISTGDIVRTSYGTGPYEVRDFQGTAGCSLRLVIPGTAAPQSSDFFYINVTQRIGGRWFAGTDEIFVEHQAIRGQLPLFGLSWAETP